MPPEYVPTRARLRRSARRTAAPRWSAGERRRAGRGRTRPPRWPVRASGNETRCGRNEITSRAPGIRGRPARVAEQHFARWSPGSGRRPPSAWSSCPTRSARAARPPRRAGRRASRPSAQPRVPYTFVEAMVGDHRARLPARRRPVTSTPAPSASTTTEAAMPRMSPDANRSLAGGTDRERGRPCQRAAIHDRDRLEHGKRPLGGGQRRGGEALRHDVGGRQVAAQVIEHARQPVRPVASARRRRDPARRCRTSSCRRTRCRSACPTS